jgi:GNAT superfamily N-acetyltransferase
LKIIEVKDPKTLKTWCHITSVGFSIPEAAEPGLVDWFTTDIQLKQPLKFYLGLLQGKPIATSMYFLAEGVAGIYFVATVPEARNQGVGFAITQRPLQEARKMGYRVGILQASKMGEPVYRRMGFKEYCKTGSYSWLLEGEKK